MDFGVKGVTPEIATTLLITTTIAAGGTVSVLVQDYQENPRQSTQNINFNTESLSVEQCWRDRDDPDITNLLVRNSGTEALETSSLDLTVQGQLLDNSEYSIVKNKVDSQETFKINLNESVNPSYSLAFVSTESDKEFTCTSLEKKYALGPSIGEKGLDETSHITWASNQDYSIMPKSSHASSTSSESLCLGSGCKSSQNSCNSLDNNCRVNANLDLINGSTSTDKINYSSTTNMCLGDSCTERENMAGSQYQGILYEDTDKMDGTLYVESIRSTNNLCIGPDC